MGAFVQSLLQTLGGAVTARARAKQEATAEALQKKQIYSALEDAALRREHLRKIMAQMSANPDAIRIANMEKVLGRKLTDVEKLRELGIAPKEFNPTTGRHIAYTTIPDPNNPGMGIKRAYYADTGEVLSEEPTVIPSLAPKDTDTTDEFGLHRHSVRKPILKPANGGLTRPGTPSKASGVSGKVSQAQPTPSRGSGTSPRPGAGPLNGKSQSQSVSAGGIPPSVAKLPLLDADGHIPTGSLAHPLIREAANELLDGRDLKDIKPAKIQTAASALARRFRNAEGDVWEQGKFTPKEKMQLRISVKFIDQMLNDGSLKALDDSAWQRNLTEWSRSAPPPEKEKGVMDFVTGFLRAKASETRSPTQQLFKDDFNNIVATISGIRQLTQPGRPTEASVNRLMAELPNLITAKNSADGRLRLERLLAEIRTAIQKGNLTGVEGKTSGGGQSVIDSVLGGGDAPR